MKKSILILVLNFLLVTTIFSQSTGKIGGVDDPARIAGVRIDSVKSLSGFSNGFTNVKDIDGNVYQTVKIGNQWWMAEDLRVTHYPNGDAIPNVTNNSSWGSLADNNTDDAYCFYSNNNSTDYGAIYTYAAAIADNWTRHNMANQGICPDGWHLPSDGEWLTMIDYLGGDDVAGDKLKEKGTTHWNSPNASDNSSGFTALPGGYRTGSDGYFYNIRVHGDWWNSSETGSTTAYHRGMHYNLDDAGRGNDLKSYGFSVRCVKN